MFAGVFLAFLIAHCFVTVFEMSIDTIFLCFCIDCEDNNGSTRPYFMSDGLRKVMTEMKKQVGETLVLGDEKQMELSDMSTMAMLAESEQQHPYPYGQYPAVVGSGVMGQTYPEQTAPYPSHTVSCPSGIDNMGSNPEQTAPHPAQTIPFPIGTNNA